MTTRLLHLIDDAHPAAAAMLPSLAATWQDVDHRVLVLGSAAFEDELRATGLEVDGRTSFTALRRASPAARGCMVVAWSPRCARAASVMLRRNPCAWVVSQPPDRLTLRMTRKRHTVALCINQSPLRSLREAGLSAQLVMPPFDARLLGAPPHNHRPQKPGERVIALLADDPRRVDVLMGSLAVSLLDEAMRDDPAAPRVQLLVHPEALNLQRGRKLADTTRGPHRLRVEPRMDRPWQLLRECDAAMLWGSDTTAAASWARAAGIVTVDIRDGDPRHAADQLRQVVAGSSHATSPEASEKCDLSGWREAIESINN